MLKSKRGISPILATLLLIVIAVAAIVVTYAWVITFTGSTTEQASVFLSKENVSWPSSSQIQIVIRNTGTGNGKITAVYIGTQSSNLTAATVVSPSLPANINAGSTITLTLTQSWSSGTRYYFKVATDGPAVLEFSEKAP